jgi:glycine dehydrogenase
MAGMKVVVIKALENGYIDVEDLKAKAEQYSQDLAGIMITYPSTYGVYEETIKILPTSYMLTAGRYTWMAPT